jgi:hypothetical protein
MNAADIQTPIEAGLALSLKKRGAPPIANPLQVSPWVAMSLLQKAIRRGREDLALRAAATLLRDAPERLWRRLGCIAVEDIGLGDLAAVQMATAALEGARSRTKLGGDWAVASCVVSQLSVAIKCRAADDLLMVSDLHPAYRRQRAEWRGAPLADLLPILSSDQPIEIRAVALHHAIGGARNSYALPRRRAQAMAVFDHLSDAGAPSPWVDVARLNYRRTGEPLGPMVALLSRELVETAEVLPDNLPPALMIGDIPGWAYDLFSREGRLCLVRFLETGASTALWIHRRIRPSRRIAFLGHIVFRVEGGLVDRRLGWPLAVRMRAQGDAECSREWADASEVLSLMLSDMEALNDVRAGLTEGIVARSSL